MGESDKSSKWLIQHHGDSILRLAGVAPIESWRPLQAEIVQPRQLPDGLLEVKLIGQRKPDLFVLEIGTYPEDRLLIFRTSGRMIFTVRELTGVNFRSKLGS